MSDVLKKPIHLALLRPTTLQKLADRGVIEATKYGLDPKVSAPPLPVEAKVSNKIAVPKVATSDLVRKSKLQIKLRVVHDSVPPLPADKQPPCESCKTAACCYAFIVNISELEYNSGVYGDAAIKLTPEIYEQLRARTLLIPMIGAPVAKDRPQYLLEGKLGEPCPFLQGNKCGIYDIRPQTCRTYTCVGDSRITEDMRQGTEPVTMFSLFKKRDAT